MKLSIQTVCMFATDATPQHQRSKQDNVRDLCDVEVRRIPIGRGAVVIRIDRETILPYPPYYLKVSLKLFIFNIFASSGCSRNGETSFTSADASNRFTRDRQMFFQSFAEYTSLPCVCTNAL
jgi:hypothetical protein